MMEPFDWNSYLYEQQRRMNASGGLPPEEPPVQRTPLDEIPETVPEEPEPVSPAQQTAKTVLGIGTTGPMAERQNQAVDDYAAQRAKYFETTGQHEPQQFGRIEGTFLAESPLKPKEAIESMMATKTPQELERYANMRATRSNVVTPQQQLAKNQAYEEKAQQDRIRRDQERDRLRTQGYANREAARDKDMDMWSQFRTINGVGGGGYGGGPQVQQMGGAVFVGPGFGQPVGYGYGRGGYGHGMSPEQYELRLREIKRLENKDNVTADQGGQKIDLSRRRTDVAAKGLDNQQKRFEATQGRLADRDAQDLREEFDAGVKAILAIEAKANELSGSKVVEGVGEDLVPWKRWEKGPDWMKYADTDFNAVDPVSKKPGVVKGGSYGTKADRLVMLARRLKAMKQKGIDIGEIAPDTNELIARLARERGYE